MKESIFIIVMIKNILDSPERVHGLLGHVRHAGLVDQRQKPEHQLQRGALHLVPQLALTTRHYTLKNGINNPNGVLQSNYF